MELTMKKTTGVDLVFRAPPSKSVTHRALIAAALARGGSHIAGPLIADDTEITRRALQSMGAAIASEHGGDLRISGTGGGLSCPPGLVLDLGNSGTSLRLLASVALLCHGPVVLTGSERMKARPVGPLAEALNTLGGRVRALEKPGFPPLEVSGRFAGGSAVVDAAMSSQFISSLLMAGPYAERDVEIRVPSHPASASYIDITARVMEAFGAEVRREGYSWFQVRAGAGYRGRSYAIEGDYSSASYFLALAPLCSGRVRVENLEPRSPQGDRLFVSALQAMGCTVRYSGSSVGVECTGTPRGIELDMSAAPDTVQTLCMVAAVASSPTCITGISHLKYKESDRLAGTARLLRSLGGDVQVEQDAILIRPAPFRGGVIDPSGDHRTAMSFAVLGLSTGNVKILQAECVSKSFPGFWEQLEGQGLV
jgi:3-phosphoshikimate 1-carboxyvinyltransferase